MLSFSLFGPGGIGRRSGRLRLFDRIERAARIFSCASLSQSRILATGCKDEAR